MMHDVLQGVASVTNLAAYDCYADKQNELL